jgi:hypothetical protein
MEYQMVKETMNQPAPVA